MSDKRTKRRKWLVTILVMTALAVGSWMVLHHSKVSQLLLPHDGLSPEDFVGKGIALNHRFVRLNPKAWEQAFNEKRSIRLELFNGEAHTLMIKTTASQDLGQQMVQGTVEGVPYGEFTLTKVGNSFAGSIDLPVGRRFTITPCGKDVHCLVEPDRSLPKNCATGRVQPPRRPGLGSLIERELTKLVSAVTSHPTTGPRPPLPVPPPNNLPRRNLRVRRPFPFLGGSVRSSRTNPLLPRTFHFNNTNTNVTPSIVNHGISVPVTPGLSSTVTGSPVHIPFGPYGAISSPHYVPDPTGTRNRAAWMGSPPVITLVVLYTPKTKAILGGEQQTVAFAAHCVNSMNHCLGASKAWLRMHLKGVEEFPQNSSGNIMSDFQQLQANPQAILEPRNRYQADLAVVLSDARWNDPNFSGPEGIANAMSAISGQNPVEDECWCIVMTDRAENDLTFHHELGHNLGGRHGVTSYGASGASPPGPSNGFPWPYEWPGGSRPIPHLHLKPWSHGYHTDYTGKPITTTIKGHFRARYLVTIMGSPGETGRTPAFPPSGGQPFTSGSPDQREDYMPRFSNPNIVYLGNVCGRVGHENNARTFSMNAPIISRFR